MDKFCPLLSSKSEKVPCDPNCAWAYEVFEGSKKVLTCAAMLTSENIIYLVNKPKD